MERNQTPTRGARLASSISENIIKYFPHHILHQTRMPNKLNNLKQILDTIRKELREKDKIHEKAQKEMRTMQSYSKQAILLIHQKRIKEAEALLKKAHKIHTKLNHTSTTHPDIIYSGLYSAALQENSEANIFLTLTQENQFITPEKINVPPTDYILGLADVIGEYRRLALDALRVGDAEKGEKHLQTMDEMYTELMAMDESYMLVPGLRRKCDVARKIIEITRGDITQEIRRNALEKHLKKFETMQKKKNQT
jgi:translin